MSALLKSAEVRDYPKGKSLFMAGDPAGRFYTVINGWIKLYRTTPEGEEAILSLYTRGDVFGEAAIIGKEPYNFSAEVAEDARLLEIPAGVLVQQAAQHTEIMTKIVQAISREMSKLQMENEHLSVMSAPQRVGCLLLQISSGMLGKGGTFSFPYDKSLAAARLGMKAETFSRALAQLKPLGVTVRGSEITIGDFSSLMDFSCRHCSGQTRECRGSQCRGACAAADGTAGMSGDMSGHGPGEKFWRP